MICFCFLAFSIQNEWLFWHFFVYFDLPPISPSSPAHVRQQPHSEQPESPEPHPQSIPGLRSGLPDETQWDP